MVDYRVLFNVIRHGFVICYIRIMIFVKGFCKVFVVNVQHTFLICGVEVLDH